MDEGVEDYWGHDVDEERDDFVAEKLGGRKMGGGTKNGRRESFARR